MKIHPSVPNWILSLIFFLAGGTWSLVDRMTKATSWQDILTPWYVFLFFGGAFIQLISFWVTGKINVPKPEDLGIEKEAEPNQETSKDQ